MPLPGIMADIVDETGHAVDKGKGGILVIKTPWPSMIRTIWGDPERFKKSYYPEDFKGKYYLAGDGANCDLDGYFWIMGRIDDVLNVSGHRLGTMEIESALVANPLVAEAAVVGKPHDIKGEAVVAFVVLKGARPEGAAAQEIAQKLRNWVGTGDRPDRQARRDPLRRQPAQDPLGQDHAPAAARAGEGRGDHAGRVDAGESGHPRAVEDGRAVTLRCVSVRGSRLLSSLLTGLVGWFILPRLFRRDGRAVEGARLESVYTGKTCIEGSNPSLSANLHFIQAG